MKELGFDGSTLDTLVAGATSVVTTPQVAVGVDQTKSVSDKATPTARE